MSNYVYATADEAIQELNHNTSKYQTLESLQKLASQVSSHSEGKVTVLYSAADGEVYELLKAHPDTRMIGKSAASKFLEKEEFIEAVAKATRQPLSDYPLRDKPLNEQFNGIRKGDFWNDLSARFVSETHGQVYGLTGVAPPERIWAQTEIFEALNRNEVPAIEGIPRTTLTQARDGLVEARQYVTPDEATFAVRAKVSTQADHNLRNSTVGIDADGKIQWIDTERLTNGALHNLPKPPELTYTLYAEHQERKLQADLQSDNPKVRDRAQGIIDLRQNNSQTVTESVEALHRLPDTQARQAVLQMMKHQGSMQELYPNEITNNQKALTQTLSDLNNPNIQTIGGVSRTELTELHQTLTQKHGYNTIQANEAVHARVTLNTAIDELQSGKLNTSEEILRSHAITRQTANIMGDAGHDLSKQVTAYNLATNGASPEIIQSTLNAPIQRIHQSNAFVQAHHQTDNTLEVKTTRPHSVDTQHINNVLVSEHRNVTEYRTEQAAKAQAQTIERAQNRSINLESERIHINEPHLSKSASLGVKGVGVAGAAIEAGLGYIEVKDAIKQANSTREQYVAGFEAGGNAAVKSAVTGVAGLGGGIVGGAGGAITPVPGGAAIGAIGVGGAAAYGAGELYEDSAPQRAVKAVSRGAGEFAYDHISKEGRLAGDIRELKEQISQTTDPAKTRALNEQLNQTTQAFNVEADKNARQIGAEHALDATRTDVKKDNPKLWNVSLDSQLDRAVEQGYSGNEAVRIAVGNAAARDTNVSAVHSDQLRTLAQNANFNAKQADIQSVTDALSNGRAMNYERQQAIERKVMASEWRDVQSVTDVLTAARNGELKLNPVHKVEHHYVKTVVTHKPMGLHQGDHGENVKQLQNALKLLGADIEADGHFGKSTTQALKDFQKEHHLKVDGELDRKTGQTLVKELKALDAQPTNTIQEPSVQAAQPISISPEQQPQIDRMLAVMAQNPALAGLSREEQTTMAMGLINAAVDTPAQTQSAQVTPPETLVVPQSQPSVASQAVTSAAVTTEVPAPASLSKTQQGHVDQILGLMAEKPEFKAFNPEQQTQMAMGLMIEAHQRGEPMDKLQGVYLPQNGNTLAAQFDTVIGIVHLPTADALKTTTQQLVEAHSPQVSQQQVLQQQLQQTQSTERDRVEVQGVSMPRSNMPIEFATSTTLNRTQQGHVDLILERMAENPAFATYPAEQRTQMAMGLMVEAAKRGEPMDKLQGVYLPQNGQTLAAQFDTPIGIVHLPTQEALQAKPQDVVVAQNDQIVQQQQQEQQRAVEREQSQGRGISL